MNTTILVKHTHWRALRAAVSYATFAVAIAFTSASCGDGGDVASNESPVTCRTTNDCPDAQICDNRVCVVPECRSGGECESGICEAHRCAAPEPEPDVIDGADTDADTDTDEPDTGNDVIVPTEVGDDTDVEVIDYGPLAFTISPADGDVDFPVDGAIRIEFNQPMNALRFIPSNLVLAEIGGSTKPRTVSYDPETFVLELELPAGESPLQPATPHTFRMAEFIGAQSGETIGATFRVSFATAGYPGTDAYETLARAYGPTIYQEIGSPRIDTFTRYDFDGDLNPRNNLDRAVGAQPAYVYYAVVETPSHFFITYLLYYPGTELRAGVLAEHDLIGVQVIVAKADDDPIGELRAWSTFYRANTLTYFALPPGSYPDDVSVGSPVNQRLNPIFFEDGRRPAIFIKAGHHSPCLPGGDPVGRCVPAAGDTAPFAPTLAGAVFRPDTEADTYVAGADNSNLAYALLPFDDHFWVYRNRTAGDAAIFGGTINYRAPSEGGDDGTRPGDGRAFPTSLEFEHDGTSYGDLPFAFARADTFPSDTGVWFIDPAFYTQDLLTISDEIDLDYCFNPYLSIDARDTLAGCTRVGAELP